ncbi:NAD(P)-dependent oxidoreductase [Pelagicoccus sp. SDUM812005]|uniref:NAD(P)-dependent oxidoreductase n=1 Tax=Pelagicoccus sp. SDUM812005 TaxID=3041257 RepID=UPI00280C4FF2|nr:NAD(P)-dependent oxidoreductase [Pelagicoccus sp. SDUM812005]MDQ8183534.1 NAD(P)-dependent oxidoreductase [Pelagicoccus sp. SDUM812005]
MRKTAFFNDNAYGYKGSYENMLDYVFAHGRREEIERISDLYPHVITTKNFETHVDNLQDLEAIFSTWGMPALTAEQVSRLPNLKWIFYAAGSTMGFRQPFLDAGVRVMSANAANAIPVAEFCLAHILLGMKGYFRNAREAIDPVGAHFMNGYVGPGNYDSTVALLGNGSVAMHLKSLLEGFNIEPMIVDSYLHKSDYTLEEAFSKAQVVSNHFPNVESLKHVFDEKLFRLMPEGAVFINTGRGPQVCHKGLAKVMADRPDLTAILDVQDPEPPEEGSPLYSLPNVMISTHIAGSINHEVSRMADHAIDAYRQWINGNPVPNEVEMQML